MQNKVYIETYGCQMNVADSEVAAAILTDNGFTICKDITEADIIFLNTCSIRENAEKRIWGRFKSIRYLKKKKPDLLTGLIGCMAQRLKEKILETDQFIDIIAGPDSYRHLPSLIEEASSGHKAVNVILSREETYSDILPLRLDNNSVTAFVSIMRGCNNMCTYCVVPYVRGVERSRNPDSVLGEISDLSEKGYKEVTLLGQNVNSYKWTEGNNIINFAQLLERTALENPSMRFRFSTSHPKDISDDLLRAIARHDNICKHIHLPAQSGSNRILKLMNRGYTREAYMERISAIRSIIPDCSLSSDIITGFCTENDEDHQDTLALMEWAEFDFSYMFRYSERPGTKAIRKLKDDITEDIKTKRLNEIINLQNKLSVKSKRKDIGRVFEVLSEGFSKRSEDFLFGRTSQNKVVILPKGNLKKGDFVKIRVKNCTSATLIGEII